MSSTSSSLFVVRCFMLLFISTSTQGHDCAATGSHNSSEYYCVHQQIVHIPETFNGNTTKIWLNNNNISEIQEGPFKDLSMLHHLWLHNNQITEIVGGTLNCLDSLLWLKLSQNRIKNIRKGMLDNLTSLQYLDLDGNEITAIAITAFKGLTALVWLYLSKNRLTTIQRGVFDGLSSLQYLTLDSNQITCIGSSTFVALGHVQYLYLHSNALRAIQERSFDGLSDLRWLTMHDNNITALPQNWLDSLKNLQFLSFISNPIICTTATPSSLLSCSRCENGPLYVVPQCGSSTTNFLQCTPECILTPPAGTPSGVKVTSNLSSSQTSSKTPPNPIIIPSSIARMLFHASTPFKHIPTPMMFTNVTQTQSTESSRAYSTASPQLPFTTLMFMSREVPEDLHVSMSSSTPPSLTSSDLSFCPPNTLCLPIWGYVLLVAAHMLLAIAVTCVVTMKRLGQNGDYDFEETNSFSNHVYEDQMENTAITGGYTDFISAHSMRDYSGVGHHRLKLIDVESHGPSAPVSVSGPPHSIIPPITLALLPLTSHVGTTSPPPPTRLTTFPPPNPLTANTTSLLRHTMYHAPNVSSTEKSPPASGDDPTAPHHTTKTLVSPRVSKEHFHLKPDEQLWINAKSFGNYLDVDEEIWIDENTNVRGEPVNEEWIDENWTI